MTENESIDTDKNLKNVSNLHHFYDAGKDKIHPNEIRVRYISFNDSETEKRKIWISDIFHSFEEYSYSENSTHIISNNSIGYDALFIGGNDVGRINRVLKLFLPILKSKLKVCILANATPPKRARAVAAGFDDAIDIERTSPVEAAWRSRAMWRRYVQSFEQQFRDQEQDRQLAGIADISRLSRRHKQILLGLATAKKRGLSYHEIGNMIGNGIDDVNVKHIQVLICQIRKVLNKDYKIICEKQRGYRIALAE